MRKIEITKLQQGDVLLRKLDAMPKGAKAQLPKTNGKYILAHGESGHSHVLEVEQETDAELVQIGEKILLNLAKPATVVHEEHGPLNLTEGVWEVGRVQEYDYFAKMVRPVVD